MHRLGLGCVAFALLSACEEKIEAPQPVAQVEAAVPEIPPISEPETLDIGTTWNFQEGSKGAIALTSGWATPEPWGTWSMEATAAITLPIDPKLDGKSLDLEFTTQGYVNDRVPQQIVVVTSGEAEVGKWTFDAPLQLGVHNVVTVPAAARTLGTPLLLEFSLPNAASPKEVGESEDERKLALGLVSVSVQAAN